MLRRRLIVTQWISLGILVLGIVMVQLSNSASNVITNKNQSQILGILTAITACFLSGFAGVYFEKVSLFESNSN